MALESVGPDQAVTVAELHRQLLPYHACRDELRFATKAEYDLELLGLLADQSRIAVAEPALVEAVAKEAEQAEPGLGFLQRFAASEITVKEMQMDASAGPAEVAEKETPGGCRSCEADLPSIEGARYCPACGADQVIPTCSGCGAEVETDWRYCALCGIVIDS
jgi:hypothetical protein